MHTDNFSYLLGVEVNNFDSAQEDMYKLEIPTTTYAVFRTPLVTEKDFADSIQGTWKYILEEWFPPLVMKSPMISMILSITMNIATLISPHPVRNTCFCQ